MDVWIFCLVGTVNRYWMLICPSIVRSMLRPTIFRKIQWNFCDDQFHLRGETVVPQVTQAVQAGAVTSTQGSCPMSTVSCTGPSCLHWQCASYFRGTLSRSSSPTSILHCHKSAICHSRDDTIIRQRLSTQFPLHLITSNPVLLSSTEEPGRLWQLNNNSESLSLHLRWYFEKLSRKLKNPFKFLYLCFQKIFIFWNSLQILGLLKLWCG